MLVKKVFLTQDKFALVDLRDYPRIMKYKWCASKRTTKRGKSENWYAIGWVDGKSISMHQFLLGKKEGLEIDHKNRNSLDNTRKNLRFATHQQNIQNSKVIGKYSKYKGISFHKENKKWESHIQYNGIGYYLGQFKSEIYAAMVYDSFANELFGEFANLNFKFVNKKLFDKNKLVKKEYTSKYKGVSFDKIRNNYRIYVGKLYLGREKTEEWAIKKRNQYIIDNNSNDFKLQEVI